MDPMLRVTLRIAGVLYALLLLMAAVDGDVIFTGILALVAVLAGLWLCYRRLAGIEKKLDRLLEEKKDDGPGLD